MIILLDIKNQTYTDFKKSYSYDNLSDFIKQNKNNVIICDKSKLNITHPFIYDIGDSEFNEEHYQKLKSILFLIKEYNLPLQCVSYTLPKLASKILATGPATDDTKHIKIEVGNITLSSYDLKPKYVDLLGVKHKLVDGGIHGAIKHIDCQVTNQELLVVADVTQMYPHIMLNYDLLPSNVDKTTYKQLLSKSIELKYDKLKRKPYKDICNMTYGCMGDRYNTLYSPLKRTKVCIIGQALMVELLKSLSSLKTIKLFQTNSDGIIFKINQSEFTQLNQLLNTWQTENDLLLDINTEYKRIIQKDVNNYFLINGDKYIARGLRKDTPEINEIVRDCLFNHKTTNNKKALEVLKLWKII